MGRTQSKKKADHSAKRAERRYCIAKAERKGWRFINTKKKTYTLVQDTWEHVPATLVFRAANLSRFQIFFKIVSFSFLKTILASIDPETWMLQHEKFFQPTLFMLYKYLAVSHSRNVRCSCPVSKPLQPSRIEY